LTDSYNYNKFDAQQERKMDTVFQKHATGDQTTAHWRLELQAALDKSINLSGLEREDYVVSIAICSSDRQLLTTYLPEWETDAQARQDVSLYADLMQRAVTQLQHIKQNGVLTDEDSSHIDDMLENTEARVAIFNKMLACGQAPTDDQKAEVRELYAIYSGIAEYRMELRPQIELAGSRLRSILETTGFSR
jgi:hypothetical protein